MIISAVHGDKLQALLHNNKLPESDMPRVHEALEKYSSWRNALLVLRGERKHIITEAVKLLNDYKWERKGDSHRICLVSYMVHGPTYSVRRRPACPPGSAEVTVTVGQKTDTAYNGVSHLLGGLYEKAVRTQVFHSLFASWLVPFNPAF